MKATKLVAAFGLVFALGIGGSSAWAQTMNVKIPFKFIANGKEFPAGDYQIKYERGSANHLMLRSLEDNDAGDMVNFITRLSPREGEEGTLVFDKVGSAAYLSEVYMPGVDGFHLQGAPGQHTHAKVGAVK